MKYNDICKKWLNLFHLISTFSDVLTSGFPSFHILSILANCFASKFSDLLTFINFMFPTFTQFEKCTVEKSNFDSFQKVIFLSLPVVGQLHNFAIIIRGKLWEVVQICPDHPVINVYRIYKIQVSKISKNFVETFLQIRTWSNG